ncbi:hypothetical protein SLEP1_g45224 [Rubroshorea leprosula]|uniref:Uncharacterized protein n=1 Tax=Rubroshorea leprosula TaxID=152421 RepID=A0AAV5LIQ8_9ROSI|nr:hypothetical protein SLEP1_g45224 [Rubroshorea leprosula]
MCFIDDANLKISTVNSSGRVSIENISIDTNKVALDKG